MGSSFGRRRKPLVGYETNLPLSFLTGGTATDRRAACRRAGVQAQANRTRCILMAQRMYALPRAKRRFSNETQNLRLSRWRRSTAGSSLLSPPVHTPPSTQSRPVLFLFVCNGGLRGGRLSKREFLHAAAASLPR